MTTHSDITNMFLEALKMPINVNYVKYNGKLYQFITLNCNKSYQNIQLYWLMVLLPYWGTVEDDGCPKI